MSSRVFQFVLVLLILAQTLSLGERALASTLGRERQEHLLATVFEKIKGSVIIAEVVEEAPAYDGYADPRRQIGQFFPGETVEVIRDRDFKWYLIRGKDGREGWISVHSLRIPDDPETNKEWLPQYALEAFVNSVGLKSRTDQLVWVDLDRQLTHVFTGKQGEWKLKHTMPSSTGKNVSPTLRGMHEISERGEWFYTEKLARGGKYWVKFSGPYLFHSLPMDKQGNIVDYTLLERRSSGCIRLSMEDSIWFYSFIKRGTAVFVN